MNCKEGDIAIVTYSLEGNEGKVVTVGKFIGPVKFRRAGLQPDCWVCICPGFDDGKIPDRFLMPLNGLPMQDEVTEEQKVPA